MNIKRKTFKKYAKTMNKTMKGYKIY
jgi:hypothetical protein